MSADPKPLAGDVAGFAAQLQKTRAAWESWAATPEGQAAAQKRAEHDVRERERRAAQEHTDAARALDVRGVPAHPRIRALCLADRREVPETAAMLAARTAVAWRSSRTDPRFGPPPVTVVLAGRPGNGKTAALARFVARAPGTALYVLGRVVATTADNDWSGNREARERFAETPWLAIDELGLEGGDKAGPRVAALLAERHDRGLATLCATNLDVDEFQKRYVTDPRVVSRLAYEQGAAGASGGLPWWWELPDRDLRDPAQLERLLAEHQAAT